jgi:hypothetical protein
MAEIEALAVRLISLLLTIVFCAAELKGVSPAFDGPAIKLI